MKPLHRLLIHGLLGAFALFFLTPLYVMVVTSLKDMDELRSGASGLLSLPASVTGRSTSFSARSSMAVTAKRPLVVRRMLFTPIRNTVCAL